MRLALDRTPHLRQRIFRGRPGCWADGVGLPAMPDCRCHCARCRISQQLGRVRKTSCLYFFAVGNQDFNWPEVMTVRREREEQGLPYRVRVLPGRTSGRLRAIMEDAVEWLMLRAMQDGD